jgi:RNA polymerase sigma-70 factor, ECF subfamily
MSAHDPDERGQRSMTWPPAMPFASVLERARALDRTAVGRLYTRFLPVVYRYVLARVGETPTAEDLTSETFFAMIEGIGATRATDELRFAAWLLGIARNQVAMHFRRVRIQPVVSDLARHEEQLALGGEGDPLDIITARESWHEVVAALQRLTEEQRTVVLYRCVLGFSTDEVANMMGKTAGTVRALQFRALHALARLLRNEDPPPVPFLAPARRINHASRG